MTYLPKNADSCRLMTRPAMCEKISSELPGHPRRVAGIKGIERLAAKADWVAGADLESSGSKQHSFQPKTHFVRPYDRSDGFLGSHASSVLPLNSWDRTLPACSRRHGPSGTTASYGIIRAVHLDSRALQVSFKGCFKWVSDLLLEITELA
jgi:hypothetical protein